MEKIDVFGGGESPDYQRGFRDGAAHAEGKALKALEGLLDQCLDVKPFDLKDAVAVMRDAKIEGKGGVDHAESEASGTAEFIRGVTHDPIYNPNA